MSNESTNGSVSSTSEAAKETVFTRPTRRNSTVTVASSTSTDDSVATIAPPPVPVNSPSDTRSVASDVQTLADLMAGGTRANNARGAGFSTGNVNMENLAQMLQTLMAQMPNRGGATPPVLAGHARAGAQGEVHSALPPPAKAAQHSADNANATDPNSSEIAPGGPVLPSVPSIYRIRRAPTHGEPSQNPLLGPLIDTSLPRAGVTEFSFWSHVAEDDVTVGLARLAMAAKDEAKVSGQHSAAYYYHKRLAVVLDKAEIKFDPSMLQ